MGSKKLALTNTEATRTVVWSTTADVTKSPYIKDLCESLDRAGWAVTRLSVRGLLRNKHQIVHMQWPETVTQGPNGFKTFLKQMRAAAIAALLSAGRHKVVLTVHNLAPHDKSNIADRTFRSFVERRASAVVVLVPAHLNILKNNLQLNSGVKKVYIPHPIKGEAVSQLVVDNSQTSTQGCLLALGAIHPYHRLDKLVEALARHNNTRPFVIGGSVQHAKLAERLGKLSEAHDWLTVHTGFIPQTDLDEVIQNTAAVISLQKLPFNSGSPYFALPLGLPIAMSESDQTKFLQDSLDPSWIFSIPQDLNKLSLSKLEEWVGTRRDPIDLSEYSADVVAKTHIELYEHLRTNL